MPALRMFLLKLLRVRGVLLVTPVTCEPAVTPTPTLTPIPLPEWERAD